MSQAVIDNPVINPSFEEAQRHCLGLAVLASKIPFQPNGKTGFNPCCLGLAVLAQSIRFTFNTAAIVSILVVLD